MRGENPALVEEEDAGHLAAVTGEVADPAALDDREQAMPPDARTQQFADAALGQAEGAVEVAVRVGDAGDLAAVGKVGEFRTAGHHVNQHELSVVGFSVV